MRRNERRHAAHSSERAGAGSAATGRGCGGARLGMLLFVRQQVVLVHCGSVPQRVVRVSAFSACSTRPAEVHRHGQQERQVAGPAGWDNRTVNEVVTDAGVSVTLLEVLRIAKRSAVRPVFFAQRRLITLCQSILPHAEAPLATVARSRAARAAMHCLAHRAQRWFIP